MIIDTIIFLLCLPKNSTSERDKSGLQYLSGSPLYRSTEDIIREKEKSTA